MSVLYLVMGKSASGKDSVFQRLRAEKALNLKTIVPYTTRPKREGEEDGREYYFLSEEAFHTMEKQHKVMEARTYHTVHGEWSYFTADDGQIDMDGEERYLLIGTLETYEKIKEYYRRTRLCSPSWLSAHIKPVYIEVDPGIRLLRAVRREQGQEHPGYAELCRRFLADEEDFSEENLLAAGIQKRFQNIRLEECVEAIVKEISTA